MNVYGLTVSFTGGLAALVNSRKPFPLCLRVWRCLFKGCLLLFSPFSFAEFSNHRPKSQQTLVDVSTFFQTLACKV